MEERSFAQVRSVARCGAHYQAQLAAVDLIYPISTRLTVQQQTGPNCARGCKETSGGCFPLYVQSSIRRLPGVSRNSIVETKVSFIILKSDSDNCTVLSTSLLGAHVYSVDYQRHRLGPKVGIQYFYFARQSDQPGHARYTVYFLVSITPSICLRYSLRQDVPTARRAASSIVCDRTAANLLTARHFPENCVLASSSVEADSPPPTHAFTSSAPPPLLARRPDAPSCAGTCCNAV